MIRVSLCGAAEDIVVLLRTVNVEEPCRWPAINDRKGIYSEKGKCGKSFLSQFVWNLWWPGANFSKVPSFVK